MSYTWLEYVVVHRLEVNVLLLNDLLRLLFNNIASFALTDNL